MNAAIAITAYTKIQKDTLSQEENGHNLVGAALRKLETNLKILVSSEVAASRSKAFEGILTAIYFLQKSLDFNSGSDLAKATLEYWAGSLAGKSVLSICRSSICCGSLDTVAAAALETNAMVAAAHIGAC